MPTFKIKANLVVGVEIDVEADSEDDANNMFDNIGVTAKLYDVADIKYDVVDDCIHEVHSVQIEAQ